MYVRTTKARGHEYVSLAHNFRDPASGQTKARLIYNFGRKDQLDVEALKRLALSITRFLEPGDAAEVLEAAKVEELVFLGAKRLGGAHVLDGVWRRLGLAEAFRRLLSGGRHRTDVERLLFALVANRALDPGSKLSLEDWVRDDTYLEALDEVAVHQLYRAMDFLLEAHDEIQQEVFWRLRNLFNLEVDLLFVDTTSTYFEVEEEDGAEALEAAKGEADEGETATADGAGDSRDAHGALRKRNGHSKDRRPDLPQAVIGFAVTRDGIPVRCWVWPGNTVDVSLVEEVKRDLNRWKLGRVVLVLDTGFNSEANRRVLQGAGDAFILGEKLRLGKDGMLPEALTRAGRYKTLANGLKIKEVITNRGSVVSRRFVIVLNPEQAERDRMKREDIVAEAERRLAALPQLESKEHSKKACALRAHATFGRYVKQDKNGTLTLDNDKISREAKLDGKYLLTTSDPHLSAEDVVLGYKQLQQVERVNRDLKHVVDVRPVYYRLEERIKAHVLLCWLALLLIRVAENETGTTWHQLKKAFRPLMAGYHASPHGPIIQSNPLTADQKRHLKALKIDAPARYLHIPTPPATPPA